ncbi:translation initiation factor IF-2 [Candidatus Roizmanbacteria bacterium RIFCSPLOWO2_02_FULL_38_10]|uniref:Translation initiation factor IF-2 n=1 Tax=Candidatus Roizmanbacteria bacterium RIFCSPLOWO2_02_FULL_38_10 TaxID=1802074 RepID=A0A1F7JN83_9BACT|nr:MAG: translation initiation factor IF-2 [Candidatus Roizmanbacteria bacterium RIFCSPLOWO2_02_FULL_38_10]
MVQKTVNRSPVIVVLGHVDHGKTTLLDYIRKTNKIDKEIGGITQSIGAFDIELPVKGYHGNKITFIDTPGHEAFTQLRARGAEVADLAVLIVDAVDSVMPQTKESLYHIKQANIPYIVAFNKIDLPGANVERVKKDLMKDGVLFEGMGGDVPFVAISAKKGTGVKELLEMILFIASLKDLKYLPENDLKAYIVESRVEKAGISTTVIVKDGLLKVGDTIYTGETEAKVKALFDDLGQSLSIVRPSSPCVILGFKNLPEVGTEITSKPRKAEQEVKKEEPKPIQKFDLGAFFADKKKDRLKLIIKTDSQGSLDALLNSLSKNEDFEIILASIGEITKSDIFLAKASKAIIVGFATSVPKTVVKLANQEKVIIKTYSLIYQLFEELEEVSGLIKEKELTKRQLKGEAKVLANFIIDKERIAGIQVTKGKLNVNDNIELWRNTKLFGKAKLVSLKTRARAIDEIKKDMEGGVVFYPELDFNIGDMVKSYSI